MPEFFILLLKVNGALTLFCLAYFLVLRKLTFYTLNRYFLLVGIIFSSLFPLLEPKIILGSNQALVQPITAALPIIYLNLEQHTGFDYWLMAKLVFWLGVVILTCRTILRFTSLYKVHRESKPGRLRGYPVRFLNGNLNTFSFWNNIYLNAEMHQEKELEAILEHEQVHVKQWHTVDILVAELMTIFYWFNPGVWYMKKAIQENVEFITDQQILKNGIDRKAYQYSMVQTLTAGQSSTALMNHFNITAIKKRIIMMNSKRSSSFQLIRYLFVLPILLVLSSAFTLYKAENLLVSTKTLFHEVAAPMVWQDMGKKETGEAVQHQHVSINAKLKQKKPVKANMKDPLTARMSPTDTLRLAGLQAKISFFKVQDTNQNLKFKGRVLMFSNGTFKETGNSNDMKPLGANKDDGLVKVIPRDSMSINHVIIPQKYYLNEVESSSSAFKAINPEDILNIEIRKDSKDPNSKGIWIYTKSFKRLR